MVGTGDINTTNIKTNSSAGTQSRDPKIALDQRASVYPDGPVHYYHYYIRTTMSPRQGYLFERVWQGYGTNVFFVYCLHGCSWCCDFASHVLGGRGYMTSLISCLCASEQQHIPAAYVNTTEQTHVRAY